MAWPSRPRWSAAAAAIAGIWDCALGQVPLVRNAPIEVCERQGRNGGEVSIDCGQQWVILNEEIVPEFWEVHEVEFYWDRYCSLSLEDGDPVASEINNAFEDNTPRRAWDRLLWTKWTANCRALLGGCQPRAAYIGKDIGGGVLGVNVDPTTNYSSVRCLRVYQSPNITRQSLKISLGVFGNKSQASLEVLHVYSEFAGGAWQTRPPFEAGVWRLWNNGATAAPWRVAELLLFSDRFCTKLQSHGVPIASGSFMPDNCIVVEGCDPYLPWKAFDGVKKPGHSFPEPLPTFWQAPCHEFDGCRERAAWIGVDFGFSPVTIQCIQIFQPTHEGYPDFGSPSFTSSVMVEFWDGVKWKENDILTGLGHGEWFQTRPAYGMAWRLHNYDRVPESWRVYELQMFKSRDCGTLDVRDREYGDPIDSNPKLPFSEQDLECRKLTGSCGYLVHDGDERTTWQSSCSRCEQGEAWVGLLFKNGFPRTIQCFRIIQSGELAYRTDAVELAMWTGEEWEVKRFESGVGGDTWNYRPSQPMTAWRLMGMSATEEPWTMLDIAFYSDAGCNNEHRVQEIGSGGTPVHRTEHAFDHNNLTEFEASCSPQYTGSLGCAGGSAWLGIQTNIGTLELNCLLLRQHRTRSRQVTSAVLEYWDGIRWVLSNKFEPFADFGGGTWQSLPGSYGSMWRVRSEPVPGGVGVGVAELELYQTSDCKNKIEANFPSIAPVSSGFASIREVFLATGSSAHFQTMGDAGEALPEFAFDGDLGTFWSELVLGSSWVGIDLTSQIADVQCVRLAFAGLRTLQPAYSWIEAWDGTSWSTVISGGAESVLHFPVAFPGGAGWQQRPALPQSMWRVQNDVEVQAWDVAEIEFHTSTDCSEQHLQGLPIASAQTTPNGVLHGGHFLPGRAFDGNLETYWSADCELFGCLAGNAWIGLNLHMPARVRCLRLVQGARRTSQVSTVTVAVWQGERWDADMKHSGLSGGTWNRRPAMPDTLWRMVYMGRQDEACPGFPTLGVKRSWGISELEFYADDACSVRLPSLDEGAEPIASGMRVPDNPAGGIMLDSFSPSWAFDGSINSYWAAQCGIIGREEAQCEPGTEWIGLDFSHVSKGMPVEVRCVRIYQSRSLATECCDPAAKLALQRWNGTEWVDAVWRHLPRERGPMLIEGDFSSMGPCPSLSDTVSATVSAANLGSVWEKRTRRQADTCAVPLSGAVPLIANKLCEKHDACVEAGFVGFCCPVDGRSFTACNDKGFEAGHCSRCCCDVVSNEIFEDEIEFDIDRTPIEEAPVAGIELIVIRTINVMPYIGVGFTILVYILAHAPKPKKDKGCLARLWYVSCWPVQSWMESGGFVGTLFAFFCTRHAHERLTTVVVKRMVVVVMGVLLGGFLLWILLSWLLAEILLRLILFCSIIIRAAKSPFNPEEPDDRKRLGLVLAVPFEDDSSVYRMPSFGTVFSESVQACLLAVTYFLKSVMDFILVRFSLMAIDVDFAIVSVPEILLTVPNLRVSVDWVMQLVYQVTNIFSDIFLAIVKGMFKGIPRCEGPVLIFSGMWLIVITLILVRWLNYDYFGLLIATKHTARTTRPPFQKGMFFVLVAGLQSAIFVAMQCIMLLFSRALMLTEFNENIWMCPYSGQGFSRLLGRLFLILMVVLATVITFLCANGHFMGQDYITHEFGRRINMDLSRLDPDLAGSKAVVRLNVWFSILPTSLGIWVDGWNVKGYLIKQRAEVYAEEMNYPYSCPHCGTRHVPYFEVMKATGMQLSLAYQAFPFGAVIAKACEYFNNPPLLYWGSSLKCCWVSKHVNAARADMPKKMPCLKTMKYYLALLIAHLKDHVLPVLLRLVTVSMYLALVICTYLIDKDNFETMGFRLFVLMMAFSSLKAVLELMLPIIVLVAFGFSLIVTRRLKRASSSQEDSGRFTAPLFGQLAHSLPVGMAVSIYLLEHDDMGVAHDFAVLLGCLTGIFAGLVVLSLALFMELCPGSPVAIKVFMSSYACALAICVGKVGGAHLSTDQQYVIMAFTALWLVPLTGLTLRLPPVDSDRVTAPSAILPLFRTARFLSCVFGSLAGVFVGSYWHRDVRDLFVAEITHRWGKISGMGFCLVLGYLSGLVYTFTTDFVVKRRAGQWAVLVATTLTVCFGVAIHWVAGVIIGSVVGTIVGAVLEQIQTRAVQSMDFSLTGPKNSKISSSPGTTSMTGATPTALKAWMQSNPLSDDLMLTNGLTQPGLGDTVSRETTEPIEQPKIKKYTLTQIPVVAPVGPLEAWEVDPAPQALGAGPQQLALPDLRAQAQTVQAAGHAQLAATLGLADRQRGTSNAGSTPATSRSRQPTSRSVASIDNTQTGQQRSSPGQRK